MTAMDGPPEPSTTVALAQWFIADFQWPIPFPMQTCRYLANYTIHHAVPETVPI